MRDKDSGKTQTKRCLLNNKKELRINRQIRVPEIRLIDENGEQRGVLSIDRALRMAEDSGLDLVEVAPLNSPPVCRLINYGKYKFEQEKKRKEQKKHQKFTKLKEVRMQPKIETHDVQFKSRHVQEFLDAGYKVKATVRFRGRELAHTDLGAVTLRKIIAELDEETYNIDTPPRMEGRTMSMLLSPRKGERRKKKGDADAQDENA